MRAPDKLLCLWVKKAWESDATEVIINSIKVCGIFIETDGREDGLVHCINLEGWQLTPQLRSRPRQPRSSLANNTGWYYTACMHCRTVRSAESTRGSTLRVHALYCWVILTPPSFCSLSRIVPTSWEALKLRVPVGRNRGNMVLTIQVHQGIFILWTRMMMSILATLTSVF